MTSNKNSVYNITSKKISTAIDLIGIRLPSFNSEIKEKLTILKTDLENHSFALDLEKAKKVFEHPQIESLIILYIQYLLLQNIFKKNLKNRITYDKVVNKVISVIETHFADLSDEASIYDIVQMLNYMFNFCNSDFKDCNFKKIILEDFPCFTSPFILKDTALCSIDVVLSSILSISGYSFKYICLLCKI